MTGARYGALGVLNVDRNALAQFVTVGLDDEAEERIGAATGGACSDSSSPTPSPCDGLDWLPPRQLGFPVGHPPMSSFLGVPIKVRDEVYGLVYLTDKVGWSEFTDDDQALVEALASRRGIAIENTLLHERVRTAAVFDDRDRLARDLHDTVIQRLFAVGLPSRAWPGLSRLPGWGSGSTPPSPRSTRRSARSDPLSTSSAWQMTMRVRAGVVALVHELEPVVGFEVPVIFDGPIDSGDLQRGR